MAGKINIRRYAKDYNRLIDLANTFLNNKSKYAIFDTETTGLGKNDVIIQIGLIDLDGNILMDSLIKPTKRKRISTDAVAIHGISMKMLENAPSFKEIFPKFKEIIESRQLIIYNANYDIRLVWQTANQDGFEPFGKVKNAFCLMKAYSMFVGEWSDYHRDFKYQPLQGGDHSVIGDCLASLKVLKEIANGEKKNVPKWWQFFI